jgi:hypothetical protein
MYSFWLLLAVLLAVPLLLVWRLRRSRSREFCNRLQSVIQPSVPIRIEMDSSGRQTRPIRYISPCEFLRHFMKCRDLIVIDLRVDAQCAPFPVPAAFVLPVPLDELEKVLKWLPTGRSIVFYGTTSLSISIIERSRWMNSSAPLYVLQDDLSRLEVA